MHSSGGLTRIRNTNATEIRLYFESSDNGLNPMTSGPLQGSAYETHSKCYKLASKLGFKPFWDVDSYKFEWRAASSYTATEAATLIEEFTSDLGLVTEKINSDYPIYPERTALGELSISKGSSKATFIMICRFNVEPDEVLTFRQMMEAGQVGVPIRIFPDSSQTSDTWEDDSAAGYFDAVIEIGDKSIEFQLASPKFENLYLVDVNAILWGYNSEVGTYVDMEGYFQMPWVRVAYAIQLEGHPVIYATHTLDYYKDRQVVDLGQAGEIDPSIWGRPFNFSWLYAAGYTVKTILKLGNEIPFSMRQGRLDRKQGIKELDRLNPHLVDWRGEVTKY
ncbi:hypothetical protein LCGC14_3076260, partial [marine sediment metagenome]